MSRLAILAALLASLAACAASQVPVAQPVSGACRGSFAPECMQPYATAARVAAGDGFASVGGTGGSIPTLSAGYAPLAPVGFQGAARVSIVGDQ